MSDWAFLNKHRDRNGFYASTEGDGKNGRFIFPWRGNTYCAVCSDGSDWDKEGEKWFHVSISRVGADRCPSWEIMCEMKALFYEPEDCVVQFHPPESDYVNNHAYCLHLWKWMDGEFPRPPSDFVGYKELGDLTP